MNEAIILPSSWRVKRLVFFHLIAALLLISFFFPPFSEIWKSIDSFFFRLIHTPLGSSNFLRHFWAFANHRFADWFEDFCVFGFYLVAVLKQPKGQRLDLASKLIFCVFLIAFTILFMNRFMARDLLRLRRESPTLVIQGAILLPDYLPWIPVKVVSTKCFPADHATTALIFSISYAYLVRGRLALYALLYGAFLCLPRLVVGAHWLSDLVVGSGFIVLLSFSWAFCTPFGGKCSSMIQKVFAKKRTSS